MESSSPRALQCRKRLELMHRLTGPVGQVGGGQRGYTGLTSRLVRWGEQQGGVGGAEGGRRQGRDREGEERELHRELARLARDAARVHELIE